MGAGCKHVPQPAPGRTAPQMRNDARAATLSEARAHGAHASAGVIMRTGSDADDENAFSSFSRTYLRRGRESAGGAMGPPTARGAIRRGERAQSALAADAYSRGGPAAPAHTSGRITRMSPSSLR